MFIEFTEFSSSGDKIGPCIINTDEITHIDNYDSVYKIWEVHVGHKEDSDRNTTFYVKKEGYAVLRDVLLSGAKTMTDTRSILE